MWQKSANKNNINLSWKKCDGLDGGGSFVNHDGQTMKTRARSPRLFIEQEV